MVFGGCAGAMGRAVAVLVGALLLGGLAGCATTDSARSGVADSNLTAEWVSANSKIERDDFKQSTSVRGPDFEEKVDREGSYYRTHIRAMLAKNGAERIQIYVATHLDGSWRNFRVAHDQDGIPLVVSKMARKKQCKEEGCVYYEHFGMMISTEYLEARVRNGIDLVVSGPGGEMSVVIPASYVEGFLNRIDSERTAMSSRAGGAKKSARLSYCKAKFGSDDSALAFCEKQARASFSRVKPALDRSRQDSFTGEAKALEGCMRRHNGSLGIDWMMVEHCFGKAGGTMPARPAPR